MSFKTTTAPDLPPGRYLGIVRSIEERHSDRYGSDYLTWRAEVALGPKETEEVSGTSSLSWSSKSKAYGWGCAILGEKLDAKAPPEFEALCNRRVILHVGPNENDWPAILDMDPYAGSTAGLVGFGASGEAAAPAPEPVAVNGSGWGSLPAPAASKPTEPATSAIAVEEDMPF